MELPDYYLPIMPYLILSDAERFLNYAKTVFNATEKMIVPGESEGKIMHGEIVIGRAAIMFANASEQWQEKSAGMFLFVDDVDAVYKRAEENNSKMLMPPAMQDYGYSAGFEDPFGNHWWITATS